MAPSGNREELIDVEGLRALPWDLLRPSALVDFVQLSACGKPAIRLLVKGEGERRLVESLSSWCGETGLDFASDGEGYACIAVRKGEAAAVIEIDRRAEAHELELGLALGYPPCCCERVARVGESAIDNYAGEVATWTFEGLYRRIDPSGYRRGLSLICHLPCSATCEASLVMANKTREFLLVHKADHLLSRLTNSPVMSD